MTGSTLAEAYALSESSCLLCS